MDAQKEAELRIRTLETQRNDALAIIHNLYIEIAVLQARIREMEPPPEASERSASLT